MAPLRGLRARVPFINARLLKRAGAALLVLGLTLPFWAGDAKGAIDGAAVSITPAEGIVDFQFLSVDFTGMPAGEDVRVRQCPAGANEVSDCKQDSPSLRDPGDQRITRASETGTGSSSFLVKAGTLTSVSGNEFACDAKNACQITVFELNQNTGNETGMDRTVSTPIGYAGSTVPCPQPKGKGRVAGSGSTSAAAAVVEWQSETCGKPMRLQLSYIVTNSPQGKESFVHGLTDSEYTLSAIPLHDDEKAQLAAASPAREAVHIPITAGSLSLVYNYWEDFDRCDTDDVKERVTSLRFSPNTLAGIVTGRILNLNAEEIAADNPELVSRVRLRSEGDCVESSRLPSRQLKIVGRADKSSATWILSSYLIATAKDAWEAAGPDFQQGPTEIFPSSNGVDLRTGSAAVARQVRTFDGGQGIGDIPDAAWLGFVDSSVGRQVGLPSAALRNAADNFVKPATENVIAGLQASTLNADITVTPNYTAAEPGNAYPLTVVTYLITDKGRLNAAQTKTLKAFAAYALTDGQVAAEKRGYIPLPTDLAAASAAAADSIGGDGGDRDGPGRGNPDAAGAGVGGADDDDDGDALDGFIDEALGGARDSSGFGGAGRSGGSSVDAADLSPVEGSLAAQQIGPAGGPAGIVRALTVFLAAPLLVVLGIVALLGGRALTVFAGRTEPFAIRDLFKVETWRHAT